MKHLSCFIFTLLVVGLAAAALARQPDGPWESYYENGQLWEKATYQDGKAEGPYEAYFDNGNLKEKGTCKDGKKDGPCESYYPNGQFPKKGMYKDGKKIDQLGNVPNKSATYSQERVPLRHPLCGSEEDGR